ncbi:MAG: YggW family oxidoreductase [Gammaproteobacteria bacterium RIFOXYB2_FULL_38_6]|nr:MAG: YggW family oxidoreductase [Gammaproteobacteria bacterium RIFOXYB2_FULL_38_6]
MLLIPEQIPLSLYIHLPWCVKKCPYCDFTSFEHPSPPWEDYLENCLIELETFKIYLQSRTLQTIFIGGGTPNLFSPKQINYLLNQISKRLPVNPEAEISMEANPGIKQHAFKDYHQAGVNRLSLGVQSFQKKFLNSLGRIHDDKEIFSAIEEIKKAGFKNFNLDLMFGLPDQSIEEGLADLQTAVEQNPTHISWYQLTLEPNTPFGKHPPLLPDDENIFVLQQQGQGLLKENKFNHYEISAFSKKNFECQHNLNYWQFGDYIGIGTAAHSKLTDFEQQKIFRIENDAKTMNADKSRVPTRYVSTKELPLEFMMNALRLQMPFSLSLFEGRTGLPLQLIKPILIQAEKENFLTIKNNHLYLTEKGKRFTNQLLLLF